MCAAVVHLLVSTVLAALIAWLVFSLWYPYPYQEISGGRDLFLLIVAVDVVLGPLMTFLIFNQAKAARELRRDLLVVVLLQCAGLGYGIWTVYLARPVHVVFEIDRFRIVHHIDVPQELLSRAPADVRPLPLLGPTLLAARPFANPREKLDATMIALQGVQIGARPDMWESYEAARVRVLDAAQPASSLKERFPLRAAEIDAVLRTAGRSAKDVVHLPLIARNPEGWTVLLDAQTAAVLGYVSIDSF